MSFNQDVCYTASRYNAFLARARARAWRSNNPVPLGSMKQENQENTVNFDHFGLHAGIMQALEEANFKTPSSIQQEVIPHILAKRDLVGQAQTGTGKTGAFGLPSLHLLQADSAAQMLVMTPTRELAKQVSDELFRYGRHIGIKTAVICGGKGFKNQIEAMQRGVRVIVATPGRMLDLLSSNRLEGFHPSIVVLDEADEMLDMGFLDDIVNIFKYLPKKRQTLLFSATMPQPIKKLAEKILHNPLFIAAKQNEKVNLDIEQSYCMIREDERELALIRLVDFENPEKAVIFCRTKKDVDTLTQVLVDGGYTARGLHGDMEQPQREEVIRHFRSGHARLLVATDVAARGLSVPDVSHVFNFHLPFDPTQYVHRIGRTGRAGRKGFAINLLTIRDFRDFQRFEKALGLKTKRNDLPTLNQVREAKRGHVIQKILQQPIHEESERLLALMGDVDPSVITAKLLSMFVPQLQATGPDRFGDVRATREGEMKGGGREERGRRGGFGQKKKPPHRFAKPFAKAKR